MYIERDRDREMDREEGGESEWPESRPEKSIGPKGAVGGLGNGT